MTVATRFRYPLEPVLLMRQWARDALLADLSRVNASMSALRSELAVLARQSGATASGWNQRSRDTNDFSPGAYRVVTAFLQDMARQGAARQAALDALDREAAALIEKVVATGKALQVVERHRERVEKEFDQARACADCKLADEQWSAQHSRKDDHEA
jgi:flagellar biosynthesis chaperone FliJ